MYQQSRKLAAMSNSKANSGSIWNSGMRVALFVYRTCGEIWMRRVCVSTESEEMSTLRYDLLVMSYNYFFYVFQGRVRHLT